MAVMSSLEAVRRKIRSLQEQADAAEERAGRLQREVDQERALREEVGLPLGPGLGARGPGRGCPADCRPAGRRPLPWPPCPSGWLLPAGRWAAVLRSPLGNASAARAGPRCGALRDSAGCAGHQQNPELV